jgi:hypothetical protein
MNPQPTELGDFPKASQPLGWQILKWLLYGIVALLVVATSVCGIRYFISGQELQAEIAKIRAAGRPMTFAEWQKTFPSVAEANDAAPFYKAAFTLYQPSVWSDKVADMLDRLQPTTTTQPATSPAPSDAEIKEALAANAAVLEQIDLGSSRPQCACDFDLSQSAMGVMLPDLAAWRALAKLMQIRTIWLARHGHVSEAVNSLVSSFRLLRVLDRHPALVASLVKSAGEDLFVRALPEVLEAGSLSDRELEAIESVLAGADPTVAMDRVWIGEQVCTLEMRRQTSGEEQGHPRHDKSQWGPRIVDLMARPAYRWMIAGWLRASNQCLEASRKSWPEAFDVVQKNASSGLKELEFFSYDKAFGLFGRTAGNVRSAQVAVMAERYRLAKGQLPVSLQELRDLVGHDLPADPFTGKDLIYKVQGKGFMVYSVGEDKVDDGGPVQSPRKDWGLAVRWGP